MRSFVRLWRTVCTIDWIFFKKARKISKKTLDFAFKICYNGYTEILNVSISDFLEDIIMLKLIIGVKGTGKTKTLINLVNGALEVTKGDVVCIEKGTQLRYDIKPAARLIDADEYMIADAQALYGFIAGILASNHDVTDLFVDGTLKICCKDMCAFDKLLNALDALLEKININLTMTVSMPIEEASETVKKYL